MQKSLSQKLVQIFLILLLVVSAVILVSFYVSTSDVNIADDAPLADKFEAFGGVLDVFMVWAYILLGIAAAAAIIPSVLQLAMNPKAAVKSIVSIAILGGFVLLAYSLSDGTPFTAEQLPGYDGDHNVEGWLELADTMIFSVYFLLAGVVLSWIYSEVAKAFK